MVMLTFSVLDLKYPFWANLVQIIKIGAWTNSDMPKSIVVFISLCFILEIPFSGKYGPKKSNWSV